MIYPPIHWFSLHFIVPFNWGNQGIFEWYEELNMGYKFCF